MTLETGQQITTILILPNILRNKRNQAMKLSWLIDYNIENICLEKSGTRSCRKAVPRTFYKKSKLSVSLDQQS